MAQNYPVPSASHQTELIIKKSRFIARAAPVSCREEAMAELARARADYPDARHHCFAYLLGKPGAATNAAMGDDGEPSGTAGKPILNVIEHKGIGDVMVVVIRYFGGIKLGAGGLVRAYSGVTEKVMSELAIVEHEAVRRVGLSLDFHQEQSVRHWAGAHAAPVETVDYSQRVVMTLTVPELAMEALRAFSAANGLTLDQDKRD